jgi:hypothetical protein
MAVRCVRVQANNVEEVKEVINAVNGFDYVFEPLFIASLGYFEKTNEQLHCYFDEPEVSITDFNSLCEYIERKVAKFIDYDDLYDMDVRKMSEKQLRKLSYILERRADAFKYLATPFNIWDLSHEVSPILDTEEDEENYTKWGIQTLELKKPCPDAPIFIVLGLIFTN